MASTCGLFAATICPGMVLIAGSEMPGVSSGNDFHGSDLAAMTVTSTANLPPRKMLPV